MQDGSLFTLTIGLSGGSKQTCIRNGAEGASASSKGSDDNAAAHLPAPFTLGCRVQVLYNNGVWYSGTLTGSMLREKAGSSGRTRYRVLFDDADAIW